MRTVQLEEEINMIERYKIINGMERVSWVLLFTLPHNVRTK